MKLEELVEKSEGFNWDKGNITKNWEKHRVKSDEAEQIFFNKPLALTPDRKHSKAEKRYYCLGVTNNKRFLFVSFTMRGKKIRIISARDMNRKEKKVYEKV